MPVFAIATGSSMGVLSEVWILVSMGLTVLAAAVLILMVMPGQAQVPELVGPSSAEPDRDVWPGAPATIVLVLWCCSPGDVAGHQRLLPVGGSGRGSDVHPARINDPWLPHHRVRLPPDPSTGTSYLASNRPGVQQFGIFTPYQAHQPGARCRRAARPATAELPIPGCPDPPGAWARALRG